ncbi:hypothetical protein L248_0077 [Schleiferilactobacillus shenzhenensis LY-73]|uniref:Uncharacterized protein n=1 Tax=Schleiferilactobacillus shenzhenensis LY-73 TaxID=1231336 RepID=U4TX60_9LACO|nr:hypothetical protein L248_0077 [Schleiferilactobacillus shenzhenensis LY-73]
MGEKAIIPGLAGGTEMKCFSKTLSSKTADFRSFSLIFVKKSTVPVI